MKKTNSLINDYYDFLNKQETQRKEFINKLSIDIVDETDEIVSVKVMSGEIWHELVLHCVNHNWGGIQNLSLIPGTVGAAPIQNIGAYGVEVKEVIKEVNVIDRVTGDEKSFQTLGGHSLQGFDLYETLLHHNRNGGT